jgi:hypothetical protein
LRCFRARLLADGTDWPSHRGAFHHPCHPRTHLVENKEHLDQSPELTTQERHIVVALILVDQLVSPLFVSRSQFI